MQQASEISSCTAVIGEKDQFIGCEQVRGGSLNAKPKGASPPRKLQSTFVQSGQSNVKHTISKTAEVSTLTITASNVKGKGKCTYITQTSIR